jgi:hypothetical protein
MKEDNDLYRYRGVSRFTNCSELAKNALASLRDDDLFEVMPKKDRLEIEIILKRIMDLSNHADDLTVAHIKKRIVTLNYLVKRLDKKSLYFPKLLLYKKLVPLMKEELI